jgi:hypothetical protein
MEVNGHHLNLPSSDASEEWRDCVAQVDVDELDRVAKSTRLKEASF